MNTRSTIHSNGLLARHATIAAAVSADRTFLVLQQLHESDRVSDFGNWNKTAAIAADIMVKAKLEDVEIVQIPADGRTCYGDWLMPKAWDLGTAFLELVSPDGQSVEFLCSTNVEPNAVVIGSCTTPEAGIITEIVLADDDTMPKAAQGKIVLTSQRASQLKSEAVNAGAVGVVSDYHPNPGIDPQSTYWENTWGDAPGAWLPSARDSQLFGFNLSPASGARIRKRLSGGKKVYVRAFVDARSYDGILPLITGRITGTNPTAGEFLVSAHVFEPGAHDNASGGAAVLEAARVLSQLIAEGKLDRPERTIRFMLQPECYGPIALLHLRPDIFKATRAAVTLDGVGKATPLKLHGLPLCQQHSFIEQLAVEVMTAQFPGRESHLLPFDLGDNLICDPAIDVPCVWLHTDGDPVHHHSSADSLDRIHTPSLADAAIVTCSLAYASAAISEEEQRRLETRVEELVGQPEIAEQGSDIPSRRIAGPLAFESLPMKQAIALGNPPRWWSPALAAYWWIDGKRSVDEILRLVEIEFSGGINAAKSTLDTLTRGGYVTWQKNCDQTNS